jgi:hypothetical protein
MSTPGKGAHSSWAQNKKELTMDDAVQDEVTTSSIPLDKLTAIYIKMRDAKDTLTSKYKAEYADIEEQMTVLESEMLEICKNMNASFLMKKMNLIDE